MQKLRRLPLSLPGYVCVECNIRRTFASTAAAASGHSKWATIKHDKAKNDGAKNKQRSALAKEIAFAVKLKGANPVNNTRLAVAIEKAKKSSVPKALIETAIARGQGISSTGAKLESCTLEAIIPPNIAVVIELETDGKLRSLAELRTLVKDSDGNVTPTGYMFEKRGKVVLKEGEKTFSADDVLEAALEAGALDVMEGPDATHVILTEPASTVAVSETLATALGAEIVSSDIIYSPNEETMSEVAEDGDAEVLMHFIDGLQEFSEVQAIYTNVAQGGMSGDAWNELQRRVAL